MASVRDARRPRQAMPRAAEDRLRRRTALSPRLFPSTRSCHVDESKHAAGPVAIASVRRAASGGAECRRAQGPGPRLAGGDPIGRLGPLCGLPPWRRNRTLLPRDPLPPASAGHSAGPYRHRIVDGVDPARPVRQRARPHRDGQPVRLHRQPGPHGAHRGRRAQRHHPPRLRARAAPRRRGAGGPPRSTPAAAAAADLPHDHGRGGGRGAAHRRRVGAVEPARQRARGGPRVLDGGHARGGADPVRARRAAGRAAGRAPRRPGDRRVARDGRGRAGARPRRGRARRRRRAAPRRPARRAVARRRRGRAARRTRVRRGPRPRRRGRRRPARPPPRRRPSA
jgi:hypothetical protein